MARRRGRDLSGILLLDKPLGHSSNAALQRARRLFDARKAGHTGNLDPLASGLLPVCFGEATKLCQFLLDADKRYVTELELGLRTTTGDREGEALETRPTAHLGRAEVEHALARFRGEIAQRPPMHSAVKHRGQPLYKLAARGIEVPRAERRVRVHRLEIVAFANPRLTLDVTCSKGTYIRTLAEDLGTALGCGASVATLRRERVGPFELAAAASLARLEALAAADRAALDAVLLPLDSALQSMPRVCLTDVAATCVARGQPVQVPRAPTAGLLRLYDAGNRLLGVGEILADGRVAPRRLFRVGSPER
jgi:tRNA pseudouridine55 synthase